MVARAVTKKITDLPVLDGAPTTSAAIPIIFRGNTYQTPISSLKEMMFVNIAYDTPSVGLTYSLPGEQFWVYLDSAKLTATQYLNSDGTAVAVTDSDGKPIVSPTINGINILATLFGDQGYSIIGEVASFEQLRTLVPTNPGIKVRLRSWAENGVGGGGMFIAHIGTATDDGGVIAAGDGFYWVREYTGPVDVSWFGINGTSLDLAIPAALAYGAKNKTGVTIPAGSYTYAGTTPISIDIANTSLISLGGTASIDCSNVLSADAMWVYSTDGYPNSMYHNTTNVIRGIEIFGGKVAGKNGLRLGHPTYSYNGQTVFEHCSFHSFDNVIYCAANTWRIVFDKCLVSTGITSVFNAPAGLSNSGESITFSGSQISDSNSAPINIACSSFELGFIASSVLNTTINISGTGSLVTIDGAGNYENPGKTTYVPYANVTGPSARLVITNSTLVINQPSAQTKSPIYVGANALIVFNSVKFPGNAYVFEQSNVNGYRAFVDGPGKVKCSNCYADLTSGSGCIPIHHSINRLYNANFEMGTTAGWTINNTGYAAQTAVASSSAAQSGSYGLMVTSISDHDIFVTQSMAVKPGETFSTIIFYKVATVTPAGNSPGSISISFYTRGGIQLDEAATTSQMSNSATSWTAIGMYLKGIVPAAAEYATLSIKTSNGAVIYYDNIIINQY